MDFVTYLKITLLCIIPIIVYVIVISSIVVKFVSEKFMFPLALICTLLMGYPIIKYIDFVVQKFFINS